jgi:uracil-DNA glycosylase family 4
LDNVYNKWKSDEDFHHLKDGANFVPGDGPWPNPAAVLIGEAPGKHEDKLLKPFVGQSGNLLDNSMWDAGLKRPEVFITNVVKWRPINNRTPTKEEIEDSIPHLRKELMVVLPDGGLVVLLGAVPLYVVDPDLRVGKVHGEPFTRGKWTFVPMYHPSYILQGRAPRDVYKKDWAKIKELRAA